jgi:hypothetical protein
MAFEALDDFLKTATEADFDRLKAGVLKRLDPTECLVVPPGHDVALVKLQEDETLVQKTAVLIAGYEKWPAGSHQYDSSAHYIAKARIVLAMIDDLQSQRVYKITTPKSEDTVVLRDIPDPGTGPIQLRSF